MPWMVSEMCVFRDAGAHVVEEAVDPGVEAQGDQEEEGHGQDRHEEEAPVHDGKDGGDADHREALHDEVAAAVDEEALDVLRVAHDAARVFARVARTEEAELDVLDRVVEARAQVVHDARADARGQDAAEVAHQVARDRDEGHARREDAKQPPASVARPEDDVVDDVLREIGRRQAHQDADDVEKHHRRHKAPIGFEEADQAAQDLHSLAGAAEAFRARGRDAAAALRAGGLVPVTTGMERRRHGLRVPCSGCMFTVPFSGLRT